MPLWHPIHCLMAYLTTRSIFKGWGLCASKSPSELSTNGGLPNASRTTHPTLKGWGL